MRITSLPKPVTPLDPKYIKNLDIKTYDADNLYPQNVRNIVLNSKTGFGCYRRYADYLEGRGLASPELSGMLVNLNGETLADLHALLAADLAMFNGFAVHVNYDIDGGIVSLHHIPFENVRLREPDDEGIIREVVLHPDWAGRATRSGKPVKVSPDTVDVLDTFNPDPEVVLSQMLAAGGPQFYKGQVLYFSREGHMDYPFAPFHAVLTDMSTDEGLSNITNRNARNNFLPAGAFIRPKGTGQAGDTGEDMPADGDGYAEDLAMLQGDMEALKIMDITVERMDERPEFISFQGHNYDKDFTSSADEVKDCIYAMFGQEGWLAIRNGKVGFSGTLVADVERDYARRQIKLQAAFTRAYVTLLTRWAGDLPAEVTREALAVVPLVDINTTPAA